MFYTFRQNNSGGEFHFNKEKGISTNVVVEVDTLEEAKAFGERIGLYWNGCESRLDCDCCGDRWSEPWEGEKLDPVPSYYGVPLDEAKDIIPWQAGDPEFFIHYKDGTIEPFGGTKRGRRR